MLMITEILMCKYNYDDYDEDNLDTDEENGNYWLYVLTSHDEDGENYDSYEIQEMFEDLLEASPEEACDYSLDEWLNMHCDKDDYRFPQFTKEELKKMDNEHSDKMKIIAYSIPDLDVHELYEYDDED